MSELASRGMPCRRYVALAIGVLAALIGAPRGAAADTILIGAPQTDQSFIPFGGVSQELITAIVNGETPRYQQVYDASSFENTPIRIDAITFFENSTQVNQAGPLGGNTCSFAASPAPCGTFTIRLGISTAGPNLLNPAFDSNYTGNLKLFAADVLLSDNLSGGSLTFTNTTGSAFIYDPSVGDLLVDIQVGDFSSIADLTQGLNELTFQASQDVGDPDYWTTDNWNGNDNTSFGLVTEFGFFVPEPSTALLFGAGLSALGLRRRRPFRR